MQTGMNADQTSQNIPLNLIVPGNNPRRHFDPAKMQEIIASIKEKGVIQPILVRPIVGGNYEIMAGERRYRGSLAAGLSEIPAVIREADDDEARILSLIENIHRDDLSPTEEAERAGELLAYHKGDREETAAALCWDISKLNRRLALHSLVPEVRDALNERKILLGHAEILAVCPSEKQADNLEKIITHKLTVAYVRDCLAKASTDLSKAIFGKDDCQNCRSNSTVQASLFDTTIGEGKCTNEQCFRNKTVEQIAAIRAALTEDFQTVRSIQLGDNETYVKLDADGALGVGSEQAESCKACADYGAAVMSIPGHEGEIVRDVCFNIPCHRRNVVKAKEAGKPGKPAAGKSATGKGDEKKRKPQVAGVSQKVKDYRRKIYNEALRSEIMEQPAKAGAFLLSLLLSGHQSYIQDSKLRDSFKEITGNDFPYPTVGGRGDTPCVESKAATVHALEPLMRNRVAIAAAASCVEKIPDHSFEETIRFFEIDLRKNWRMDKAPDFMKLLTKSEIESVAKELALDKAVTKFNALITGKKDELIKALLSAPGFSYEGVIPSILNL